MYDFFTFYCLIILHFTSLTSVSSEILLNFAENNTRTMLARTIAAAVHGIDAIKVEVEVTVDWGSGFMIIGLPDTAVKESAERVRCAM